MVCCLVVVDGGWVGGIKEETESRVERRRGVRGGKDTYEGKKDTEILRGYLNLVEGMSEKRRR